MGQTVAVDIISTEDIQCAFYYIMSKGVLLDSKKVDIKDRKGKFSFTPTFAFAPLADIIVYYVSNGDIFCGTTSFKLRSNLSNTVRVYYVGLSKSYKEHDFKTSFEKAVFSKVDFY